MFKFLKKSFVNIDGIFYVYEMVEIHHKKTFGYIINIYFKFSKIWKRFMTQHQKVSYMIRSMTSFLVIKTAYNYMIM
jgi:hypothetical protein